jgi:hypothetical protein
MVSLLKKQSEQSDLASIIGTPQKLTRACHCLEILTDKHHAKRIGSGISLSKDVIVDVVDYWNNSLAISTLWGRRFLILVSNLAPAQTSKE